MLNSATSKPIDKYIPWMFVAFFVVIFAVNAVFVTVALKTHSGLVTEDAYEKGLAYNTALADAEKQAALGWKGHITYKAGTLRYTLNDKTGKPLAGAKVSAAVTRPVTQGYDRNITLKDTGRGIYEAPLPLPLQGVWQVHVVALAGGQDFQSTDTIENP